MFRNYSVGTTVEGRDLVVIKLTGGVARERPLLRPLVKDWQSFFKLHALAVEKMEICLISKKNLYEALEKFGAEKWKF